MNFCTCGSILVPSGKGGMKCRSCGKTAKAEAESIKSTHKRSEIAVLEDDKPNLPTMEKECPKCGNETSYFWLVQTRASDEPPTQFYRCTKCRHTWRVYK